MKQKNIKVGKTYTVKATGEDFTVKSIINYNGKGQQNSYYSKEFGYERRLLARDLKEKRDKFDKRGVKKYNYTVKYLDKELNKTFQETQYAQYDGYENVILMGFNAVDVPVLNIWRYEMHQTAQSKKMIYSRQKGWVNI